MFQHYWSLESVQLNDSWLTIGAFDGVHRGHQQIIQALTAGAGNNGAPAVVLTFYPHPSRVLGRRQGPFYLTTPELRSQILRELGVDDVITHPFSKEWAQLEAEDFIAYLHRHLNFRHLLVGYDFALGKGRKGDVSYLRNLGKKFGYKLHVVEAVQEDGEPVSSSRIREALQSGDVEAAKNMLGRAYCLQGEVISGDGRGHTIGIPTANLKTWSEQVIPGPGVYVCQAFVKGKTCSAVTNIGYRPTFENQSGQAQVEAHLLDFEGDLYGREMSLSFLARLRSEQRFPNVQALIEQIHLDISHARSILAAHPA